MLRETIQMLAYLSVLYGSAYPLHMARDSYRRQMPDLDIVEIANSRLSSSDSENGASIIGHSKSLQSSPLLVGASSVTGGMDKSMSPPSIAKPNLDGESTLIDASGPLLSSMFRENEFASKHLLGHHVPRPAYINNDDIARRDIDDYRRLEPPLALQELFDSSSRLDEPIVEQHAKFDIRMQQKQQKKNQKQQSQQQQKQKQQQMQQLHDQQQQIHQSKRAPIPNSGGPGGIGNNGPPDLQMASHGIASQLMLRSPRGQRQYDVPQIGKSKLDIDICIFKEILLRKLGREKGYFFNMKCGRNNALILQDKRTRTLISICPEIERFISLQK
ncbi:unnamed protein product [Hermetia illucens]|uniref:Uncharacterized protein n=1 Tax=Hermetia illucens TaxID=343691 RepID=A0A7R8UYQ4_HERIL|nr:unnamed protein product [Hermetia illucens]